MYEIGVKSILTLIRFLNIHICIKYISLFLCSINHIYILYINLILKRMSQNVVY